MKNITITMEDAAAEWVRIEAAKRNTSISRMLGEMVAEKMRQEDAYAQGMRGWLARDRTWRAEDAGNVGDSGAVL